VPLATERSEIAEWNGSVLVDGRYNGCETTSAGRVWVTCHYGDSIRRHSVVSKPVTRPHIRESTVATSPSRLLTVRAGARP